MSSNLGVNLIHSMFISSFQLLYINNYIYKVPFVFEVLLTISFEICKDR